MDDPLEAYYLFAALITRKLLLDDFVLHDIATSKANPENFIKGVEGEIFMISHLKISQVSNYFAKW